MNSEFFSTLPATGTLAYESMQELGAINSKALNKLAEIQLNFTRLGIESSMQQARLLSDIGSYEDLFSAESELASEYGDKMMALTMETTEVMTASRDELFAWVEKAFDGSKKAVKTARPKPAAKKSAATSRPAAAKSA